jgi:hypothetical protein
MSIGSLGKSQNKFANVSNIHFDRITVAGGLYAARLKSWVGGQGLVSNVSWTNIKIHNVTFPFFITQVRNLPRDEFLNIVTDSRRHTSTKEAQEPLSDQTTPVSSSGISHSATSQVTLTASTPVMAAAARM